MFGTTAPYNCELLPGNERLDNGVEEKPETINPSLKKRTVANNINEGSKDFMLAFVFIIVCSCWLFLCEIFGGYHKPCFPKRYSVSECVSYK